MCYVKRKGKAKSIYDCILLFHYHNCHLSNLQTRDAQLKTHVRPKISFCNFQGPKKISKLLIQKMFQSNKHGKRTKLWSMPCQIKSFRQPYFAFGPYVVHTACSRQSGHSYSPHQTVSPNHNLSINFNKKPMANIACLIQTKIILHFYL